jgi:hypothetical protein
MNRLLDKHFVLDDINGDGWVKRMWLPLGDVP